jgi:SAM-dependent methyltransferase
MSWRKYLLIPQLSLYAIRAPRQQARAWQRYWSSVRRTGADGEVLWDADQPAEVAAVAEQLRDRADLSLPLVDLGCGNGRQARALAPLVPRVLGIDVSAAAIERARRESADGPSRPDGGELEFRVADLAEPGLGEKLAAELGEVNVHIRGVLHVVDPQGRAEVVRTVAALLGRRGVAYVCESDLPGDPLEYLLFQGVTATSMPDVVRRLIAAGVRAPSHFGPAQVAEYFPGADWQVLADGPTVMHGVPLRPGEPLQRIPSYFAVLTRRQGSHAITRDP